jgi:hypothetical protein
MATLELFVHNLFNRGPVKCLHVILVLKHFGRLDYRASRQRENLEKSAVKGDQVFVYQQITGNDIIIQRKTEQRADFVIMVIGEALAVSHKDQKEIQNQFMVTEAGEIPTPQEAVTDPGEASFYLSDAIADKGFPVGHMFLLRLRMV